MSNSTTGRRFCVIYMKGGKECCSAWFTDRARAARAQEILAAAHGPTVILLD